jgi:hypothetical protein
LKRDFKIDNGLDSHTNHALWIDILYYTLQSKTERFKTERKQIEPRTLVEPRQTMIHSPITSKHNLNFRAASVQNSTQPVNLK